MAACREACSLYQIQNNPESALIAPVALIALIAASTGAQWNKLRGVTAAYQYSCTLLRIQLGNQTIELLGILDIDIVQTLHNVTGTQAGCCSHADSRLNQYAVFDLQLFLLCIAQITDDQAQGVWHSLLLGLLLFDLGGLVRFELHDSQTNIACAAFTPDVDRRTRTWLDVSDHARQIARFFNRGAVELEDDVPGFQTALISRTARFDTLHHRALRLGQAQRLCHIFCHFADLHTNTTARHAPACLQLIGNPQRLVNRHCEGDSHEATGTTIDLRVDTDDLALEIDQRPTGITGIHCNVGLNQG